MIHEPAAGALRAALSALALCSCIYYCSCNGQAELAAVIVGELGDADDAGPGTDEDPPAAFAVVGLPWSSGRESFRVAEWPLAESLSAFFANERAPGARRVPVQGADRAPLWQLRQAVGAGVYGPSRDTVVVRDDRGDQYLVVFTGD